MADIIKQIPGPAGVPGSQVLVGSGAPDNSLGNDGDFYINSSNNDYYSKVSGAWVLEGSFIPSNVPAGGNAHQVLTKITGADYDFAWFDIIPTGGTTGQALGKLSNAQFDYGWIDVIPVGSSNNLAGFDSNGNLFAVPSWQLEPTLFGLQYYKAIDVTDTGGKTLHNIAVDFDPSENSPSQTWNIFNLFSNIDPNSSGFSFGTGGQAATYFNLGYTHQGTSDVGEINFFRQNFQLGNGTDPIDIRGFSYIYGQGAINANVNLSGPMQGYGFQPNISSGASASTNVYCNSFYDFANIGIAIDSYSSFSCSPIIAGIRNNSNYVSYNSAPNIPSFQGNAGFFGLALTPNLGTFGTGGFNGVSISPNITSAQYATGLYINMGNSSAVNKKAIDATGDVNINGSLQFTGALSIGQLNAFYASQPIDQDPQSLHLLITQMTTQAGVTVANGDAIGINTAMLVGLAANSVTTSGAFGLGFATLAIPAVVETHTGSSLDFLTPAAFAVNLSPSSTGGTIDTINMCRSVVIPNGITTVNKVRGFIYDQPFGGIATVTHAFYNGYDTVQSFFRGPVKLGGTPISDDTVTNASCALEISSTTSAFVASRMTTSQKNALTAINGMVLYDTDLDKLQVYAAGSWTDLN